MSEKPRAPAENRITEALESTKPSPDRALQNFRYVVASVNDNALAVWADLWNELRSNVTVDGMVAPEIEEDFKPACGWPEFFEKLWLMKHYLDYIHRFCKQ